MKIFQRNKRGNAIVDTLTVMVVLFGLGIITVVGFNIFDEQNDLIQSDEDFSNSSKEFASEQFTKYPSVMDGIFIFLLVGLWASAIIFSFMVNTRPVFLVFTLILIAVLLAIGAYLSNAYSDVMIEDPEFSAASTNFPMTTFVFDHLVETIMAISFSVVFALFGKSRLA